ncbi:hypothetical protein CRUP_005548, partial [Coryphaenoides rupestris]
SGSRGHLHDCILLCSLIAEQRWLLVEAVVVVVVVVELTKRGHGVITTEIAAGKEFYYAEDYHQQYLKKTPKGHCGGLKGTGVACPLGTLLDKEDLRVKMVVVVVLVLVVLVVLVVVVEVVVELVVVLVVVVSIGSTGSLRLPGQLRRGGDSPLLG